jgi:tetratricopeptide (TPR) repeat protein
MTCTPDRRPRLRPLVAALLLAGLAGAGQADEGLAANHLKQALAALAKGDGIAGEMALRKAMAAGLPREAVAARMGEAFLDQGDLDKAREWLAPGRFTPDEAPHGFRVLGRLEMASGNLPAAGRAFDAALKLTPDDSRLWVDIARLRYAGGEHLQAIQAAQRAVDLDGTNPRALEFRGLLVRDQFGLAAALPWFEAGLKARPDDVSLLGEYAATLGELGRARQMLTVTRRMIELSPREPRAFYLQAVLAARAGNVPLARSLMARAGQGVLSVPSALLLQGLLELEAGNVNLAIELLDRLSRLQPQNRTARLMLARAILASGNSRQLVDTFAGEAQRPDASPWLLTALGRAYEDLGQRDRAAPLLDRAARAGAVPVTPVPETTPASVLALRYADAPGDAGAAVPYVRALLAAGRGAEAGAIAERIVAAAPGSADAQALAGDLMLVLGDVAGAVNAWRMAGAVRLSDDLMLRLVDGYLRAGRADEAERLVRGVIANSPRDRTALRLAAGFAARRGKWAEAGAVLGWLARGTGAADARVQADLAFAAIKAGLGDQGLVAARRAYALQPASGVAAEALGLGLIRAGDDRAGGEALLAKARTISSGR